MSLLKIWIVESKHIGPNGFYVKVDESEFYTAYWVAVTMSKESANALVLEASDDLDLGNIEIIDTHLYDPDVVCESEIVRSRIDSWAEKIQHDKEDVQMAAWVSVNGGLW